jgi:squalene-hopene/tetraprenyl-beta-curcumene cyclase
MPFQKKISFFKRCLMTASTLVFVACQGLAQEDLSTTIQAAQKLILSEQKPDGLWDYPAYLGSFYVSQYLLMKEWIDADRSEPQINSQRYHLLMSHQANGSWLTVEDTLARDGDLNATIWNYLFLKKFPSSDTDALLPSTLNWIVTHGGAESSNMLTRIMLASLGLYHWNRIVPIPEMFLNETNSVLNLTHFGQWVGPHLKPIAALRRNHIQKKIIDAPEIFLRPTYAGPAAWSSITSIPAKEVAKIRSLLLPIQQPHGSWGGYTLSTLISIMALRSAGEDIHSTAIQRGLNFIENRFFSNGRGNNQGSLQDGRYWDTVLIGRALALSGLPTDRLRGAADMVTQAQTASGGLPFGFDFEYAPDVDDTAEMILFLKQFDPKDRAQINPYSKNIERAESFILKMQNRDGGWGAFAKDNVPLPWVQPFLFPFNDSVDFFDESSADVTAHALEALGELGHNMTNSRAVQRAVKYLKAQQEKKTGAWLARWGVNYIYGTSSVLVGLMAVGESPDRSYIQKAVAWLQSVQNPIHGGFGESALSYRNIDYAGVGDPTASQTAWALLGIMAAGQTTSPSAKAAAGYLDREFKQLGRWQDLSTTGTGHPGIISMDYPSYPYAFSLMALSIFSKASATTSH